MASGTASSSKQHHTKPDEAPTEEAEKAPVTYRLTQAARQRVIDYALALGQHFSPSRQISNTEAMEHMILNSKLPEPAKKSSAEG